MSVLRFVTYLSDNLLKLNRVDLWNQLSFKVSKLWCWMRNIMMAQWSWPLGYKMWSGHHLYKVAMALPFDHHILISSSLSPGVCATIHEIPSNQSWNIKLRKKKRGQTGQSELDLWTFEYFEDIPKRSFRDIVMTLNVIIVKMPPS